VITQKGYAFSSLSLSHYMQSLYQETITQDTKRFLLVTGRAVPPSQGEDRSTVVRAAPRAETPTPSQKSISQSRLILPPTRGRVLSRGIAVLLFLIPSTFLFLLLIVSNLSFMIQAREKFPFLEDTRGAVSHYLQETGMLVYLDGFKEGLFNYVEKELVLPAASIPPEESRPVHLASDLDLPSLSFNTEPLPPHEPSEPPNIETTSSPDPHQEVQALYSEAKTGYNAGDLETVEKKLRQIIEIDPHSVLAYHLLGTVYQEKKEIDAALRIFSEAAALFPKEAILHYDAGFLYSKKGVDSLALQELKTALKLAPHAADSARAQEIIQKLDPLHRPPKQIIQQKNENGMKPAQEMARRLPPPAASSRERAAPGKTTLQEIAPPPPSTFSTLPAEEEKIRQLVTKQKKGFQSKNIDLILQDHLNPPPALQKRLESWFQRYDAISVNYEIYEVKVEGIEASASILQTIVLQTRNTSTPEVEKALVYWKMEKVDDLWKIIKVNVVERY
jgi:tetratricopeptide (TPR) repeat protein